MTMEQPAEITFEVGKQYKVVGKTWGFPVGSLVFAVSVVDRKVLVCSELPPALEKKATPDKMDLLYHRQSSRNYDGWWVLKTNLEPINEKPLFRWRR